LTILMLVLPKQSASTRMLGLDARKLQVQRWCGGDHFITQSRSGESGDRILLSTQHWDFRTLLTLPSFSWVGIFCTDLTPQRGKMWRTPCQKENKIETSLTCAHQNDSLAPTSCTKTTF
jgi:hypothetical protein